DRPAGGACGATPRGLLHRGHHGGHAGGVGEGVDDLLGAAPGHVTRLRIAVVSSGTPSPCRAEVVMTGTPSRPSCASSRFRSPTIDSRRASGTVSMWLRTTSMMSRCDANGRR